jgi:hypothetical protein
MKADWRGGERESARSALCCIQGEGEKWNHIDDRLAEEERPVTCDWKAVEAEMTGERRQERKKGRKAKSPLTIPFGQTRWTCASLPLSSLPSSSTLAHGYFLTYPSLDFPIQSLILNDLARNLASSPSPGSTTSVVSSAAQELIEQVQDDLDEAGGDDDQGRVIMVRSSLLATHDASPHSLRRLGLSCPFLIHTVLPFHLIRTRRRPLRTSIHPSLPSAPISLLPILSPRTTPASSSTFYATSL